MKQDVYFAYSKPTVTTYDAFGNVEEVEDLQSRYQELYAVKENITNRGAFKLGDTIVYSVVNRSNQYSCDIETILSSNIATNENLRCCFYLTDFANSPSGKLLNYEEFGYRLPAVNLKYIYDNGSIQWAYSQYPSANRPYEFTGRMGDVDGGISFVTNVPIFNSRNDAIAYQNGTLSVENAVNYNKQWDNDTHTWVDAPQFQSGKVAFHYQEGVYDLQLISDIDIDTVRYSTDGVNWENKDSVEWRSFISPTAHTVDGFEYQSVFWNTNIPIFGSIEDVNGYFNGTINIENALNYDNLSSEEEKDVALGEVVQGEMGLNQTSLRGAFCSRYAVNNGALTEITNKFFTDDETILQNIIDGLKLYGQTPMDSIIDLTYYPFDLNQFTTSSPQTYIYFGRYQLALESNINKIITLNTVIDCGKVAFPVTYNDYRDFEPYTELYAYLPYCGMTKLNISDYIGKTLGVKYGVDITTGACECYILADGKIMDRLSGQMGVRQFITSMDSAQYTSNVTNSILGGGGDVISTSVGAIGNLASGNYGGALLNVGSLAFGGAKGLGGFVSAVENVPYKTRGNSTSMLNQYDIQYPFFMFIYSDIEQCDDLAIVGKPSNKKARVNSFSGFLKCSETKVRSGATREEILMIENLLQNGIYI